MALGSRLGLLGSRLGLCYWELHSVRCQLPCNGGVKVDLDRDFKRKMEGNCDFNRRRKSKDFKKKK